MGERVIGGEPLPFVPRPISPRLEEGQVKLTQKECCEEIAPVSWIE